MHLGAVLAGLRARPAPLVRLQRRTFHQTTTLALPRFRSQIGTSRSRALLNSVVLDHAGDDLESRIVLVDDGPRNRLEFAKYVPVVPLPEQAFGVIHNDDLLREIYEYMRKRRPRTFLDDRNGVIVGNFVNALLSGLQSTQSRCYNLLHVSSSSSATATGAPQIPSSLYRVVRAYEQQSGGAPPQQPPPQQAHTKNAGALMNEIPRFLHFAHPTSAGRDSAQFTAIPDLVMELALAPSAADPAGTEGRRRLVTLAFEVREPGANLRSHRVLTHVFMHALYLSRFNVMELSQQLPMNPVAGESASLLDVVALSLKNSSAAAAGTAAPQRRARLPEVFVFCVVSGLRVQVTFLRTRDLLFASSLLTAGASNPLPQRDLPVYLVAPTDGSAHESTFDLSNPAHRLELAQVLFRVQSLFESFVYGGSQRS